jgi:hypothetical protein
MAIRDFNASQQTRTGVLTEVFEDIERTSNGYKSIATTLIPYVRQNVITFAANSLKPFTRIYVYFDKKLVNAYVTPSSTGAVGTTYENFSNIATPVTGSVLITDSVGNCAGRFIIPDPMTSGNPQFKTGDIEFILTSNVNNAQVGDGENNIVARETYAEAVYSAKGILDTQQETIISTRNAIVRTTSLSENSGTIREDERSDDDNGNTTAGDPLAQTFIVLDTDNTDEGVTGAYLTSCDIFFFAKDDTYPVTIEIRNVINGAPGPKVLPFGRKTLQSSQVFTSDDGNTATTFTFNSPVYVLGGTEYAICLLTNTPDYKVWIADLGTQDTAGNEITDQPHVGVLFKSSNNSVWVPSPTQDMKFSLKRAKFDTTAAGLVTLQNADLPKRTLKTNPIEMLDNSTTLKILHQHHSMHVATNNVTIDGVKSGASTTLNGGITAAATSITLTSGTNFDDTSGKYSRDASNVYYIKIGDEIISYTTISGTGITSATRGANSTTATAHANGATVELYQIHKVPLYDINKTHTAIGNISIDNYTITLSTTPVVDGAGSISTLGGTVVTATQNVQYDVSTTNMGILVPSRTAVDVSLLATTSTSPSGSQTSFVKSTSSRSIPLDDNYYWDAPQMVASNINEANEMSGVKSLSIPITFSSEIDTLSPVIDTQRMSLFAVANKIDVIDSSSDVYPTSIYSAMTEPEGDNHAAIYLTKKINLENAATSLRVILNANREDAASIKVMYKILRVDDAFDFDEIGYNFFNDDGTVSGSGGPDDVVNPSISLGQFNEYEYTAGVTDDGLGIQLDEFISFQIKIVLRTTNSARPPRIRQLRVLALAT